MKKKTKRIVEGLTIVVLVAVVVVCSALKRNITNTETTTETTTKTTTQTTTTKAVESTTEEPTTEKQPYEDLLRGYVDKLGIAVNEYNYKVDVQGKTAIVAVIPLPDPRFDKEEEKEIPVDMMQPEKEFLRNHKVVVKTNSLQKTEVSTCIDSSCEAFGCVKAEEAHKYEQYILSGYTEVVVDNEFTIIINSKMPQENLKLYKLTPEG